MLDIGAKTKCGTVQAIGMRDGGRFYMMLDRHGCVALIPAEIAEGA